MLCKWKQVSSALARLVTHTVYRMSVSITTVYFPWSIYICNTNIFYIIALFSHDPVSNLYWKFVWHIYIRVIIGDIKITCTQAKYVLWGKDRPHIPQRNTVATLRILWHICVTSRAVNWCLRTHHCCQSCQKASERACVCWSNVCHNNMFTLVKGKNNLFKLVSSWKRVRWTNKWRIHSILCIHEKSEDHVCWICLLAYFIRNFKNNNGRLNRFLLYYFLKLKQSLMQRCLNQYNPEKTEWLERKPGMVEEKHNHYVL